jgi:uncharacterized protein (DUF433 family)
LEREDIRACLEYAAEYFDHPAFVEKAEHAYEAWNRATR